MASLQPHIPHKGERIAGRWSLVRKIAQGGFASVWEATDEESGERCAVKCMLPHRVEDDTVGKRFQREARLLMRMEHANIVRVLDYGVTEPEDKGVQGVSFLAMEFLEGETLEELLREINGPIPLEKALGLLLPVLQALTEAHRWGIVHRDLKPDNIFIQAHGEGEGVIKLIDFGICKPLESSPLITQPDRLTRTDQVFGTPDYMAPEQIAAEPLSPATDVYAIGILLYELLVGQRPFMHSNAVKIMMMHLDDPMPRLPAPYRGHPIAEIIARATEKDPHKRFTTAQELIDALNALGPLEEVDLDEVSAALRRPAADTARVGAFADTEDFMVPDGQVEPDISSLPTLSRLSPKGSQPQGLLPSWAALLFGLALVLFILGLIVAWLRQTPP